jgi:hypothetical protein
VWAAPFLQGLMGRCQSDAHSSLVDAMILKSANGYPCEKSDGDFRIKVKTIRLPLTCPPLVPRS